MSSLPKTKYPLFDTILPSTRKKVFYRQMLVRDEKILLMAKTSKEEADINRAVKQVVNNCLMDENIDKFTTFDIEYMFLKIRSVSVGNIVELGFIDKEDKKEYDFEVDLEKVEMKYPEWDEEGDTPGLVTSGDPKDGGIAIKLRYPPATLLDESLASEQGKDAYEFIAAKCIDKIFQGDDTWNASDYTTEELVDFIRDLDLKAYDKVKAFISTTPRLHYEINYKNSKGTDRKIVLTTLTDFFTLR